jgi:hypothetical protein
MRIARTKWAGGPPSWSAALVSVRRASARETNPLVQLVESSLAKGHWKVALRRYSMLKAVGVEVDGDLVATCERMFDRCTPCEVRRITGDAACWARFVCSRGRFSDPA